VDGVPPLFSTVGRVPHPSPTFSGLKFVPRLASSCIAGQDQRSAVAIFLMCMRVRVCRPKLFKNLCLSLVSGVPPLLFRNTPLPTSPHVKRRDDLLIVFCRSHGFVHAQRHRGLRGTARCMAHWAPHVNTSCVTSIRSVVLQGSRMCPTESRDATVGSEGPRDAWTSRAFTTTSNAHGSSMMKTTRNQ